MNKLAYEETFDCVQCGYCLPACPTYKTMEKETHSPRGRINLVKMAAEGKVSLDDLKEPIDLCLGCRACETVCPTNVQYGRILDSAKELLAKESKKNIRQRAFESIMFRKVLPNGALMNVAGASLLAYQKTGMQKVMQRTGMLSVFLPEGMRAFEKMMPTILPPRRKQRDRSIVHEKPAYRIGYFLGCLMDTMFAEINNQAMQLLEQAGCEVDILNGQACCGALQNHGGDMDTAKELAKKNITAFETADYDFVVSSIGGCGAMMMEYGELLKDEVDWHERGESFAANHLDISVILAKCDLKLNRDIKKTAVYQPSCHMTHVQKNTEAPLELIKSIPGLTYKQLPQQEMCCGSAGIYNMLHFKESMKILDTKMPDVEAAQPDIIITTNPGCHLQMKMGVERAKLTDKIEVKHLVEILFEAT